MRTYKYVNVNSFSAGHYCLILNILCNFTLLVSSISLVYVYILKFIYYRIIQMYVMKEEAGALSSDMMDRNKVCAWFFLLMNFCVP